jgi:GT2 family glycosyltransferase
MDLSVCILTHDQPDLLRQSVEACSGEIERARLSAEIIIVDNASRDGYPERMLRGHPLTRLIRSEENLGFSAGNNRAIRASCGRFVLILNDDAILGEDALGLLGRKLESDAKIGAVGPKLLNPDG